MRAYDSSRISRASLPPHTTRQPRGPREPQTRQGWTRVYVPVYRRKRAALRYIGYRISGGAAAAAAALWGHKDNRIYRPAVGFFPVIAYFPRSCRLPPDKARRGREKLACSRVAGRCTRARRGRRVHKVGWCFEVYVYESFCGTIDWLAPQGGDFIRLIGVRFFHRVGMRDGRRKIRCD